MCTINMYLLISMSHLGDMGRESSHWTKELLIEPTTPSSHG